MQLTTAPPRHQSALDLRRTCLHYILLLTVWVGAWLAFGALGIAAQSSAAQFVYWTAAKLLVWILPVFLIVRLGRHEAAVTYLSLENVKRGLRVGVLFGVALAAVSLLADVATKHFGWPSAGFALVNVLLIAPVFEEIVFRGFFLRELQDARIAFWPANIIAALMFLGLHFPGWYFVGRLTPGQAVVAPGICLVGLVAGYAKRRAGSTWAGVAVHFVNNLYSSFLH